MDRFKKGENPEPETVQEKAKTRKRILALLKEQGESEKITKSRNIEEKLFSLPEFIQAGCVMFYLSFDGEVDTTAMINRAREMGKKVAVPVIRATAQMGEEKLIASLLENSDNQLSPGPYGILEPRQPDILELSDIDLVIVPGVAFDKKGNRLGRGKGYYDRFLSDLTLVLKGTNGHSHSSLGNGLKKIPLIGIAFDFQIVENIPTLSHDLPVTKLITA